MQDTNQLLLSLLRLKYYIS